MKCEKCKKDKYGSTTLFGHTCKKGIVTQSRTLRYSNMKQTEKLNKEKEEVG